MSYLNRFVIEEESQFECRGVFGFDDSLWFMRDVTRKINLKSGDKQSKFHVFISADFSPMTSLQWIEFDDLVNELGSTNLMITRIGSERLECVQKDVYDIFYNKKGKIQYDPNCHLM